MEVRENGSMAIIKRSLNTAELQGQTPQCTQLLTMKYRKSRLVSAEQDTGQESKLELLDQQLAW